MNTLEKYESIPAMEALPKTIEYSDPLAKSHASKTTQLAFKRARLLGKSRRLALSHHSAGYVMAGSAMRLDPECWSVNWNSERGVEGRRLSNESDAREYFDSFPS